MSDTRKDIFKKIHERCFQFGSCNYKETGCSDCPINVTLVKAETLLDKQEQGLLIELPCKVGDTLYQKRKDGMYEIKVIGLVYDIGNKKWMLEIAVRVKSDWTKTVCSMECVGKTIFFTEAEAEEALARMGE